MGLFDWLRKLFGKEEPKLRRREPPAAEPRRPAPVRPATSRPTDPAAGGPGSFSIGWGAGGSIPESPSFTPGSTATPAQSGIPSSTPRPNVMNLDASAFLPITRKEIKEEARGVNLWGNPWFGRRDLIPPADDPRTKLIDRGMVAQGLLTPEQLVEIHQVGAEMDRLRPLMTGIEHQAGLAGEAAVLADRERRAAIKEQKKKEAAERRRLRAEQIAHRRATDILFLGRGVSSRLHERQSDEARLQSLDLPILHTPQDLAQALGVSIPKLRWLAVHSDVARRVHYVSFDVPKKSGGTRRLSAPHRSLAKAQHWIFDRIVSKLPCESAVHGFRSGHSTLTNAQQHAGQAVLVNMDLEGFFPSITFPRVRRIYEHFGYSPAVATILALLCTECPRREVEFAGTRYFVAVGPRGLPQGACTSPGLSNQAATRLDRRLLGLARKLGIRYTRYADDLTFSGADTFNQTVGYLMARVRHFAQESGFAVHEKKSRVLRRNASQRVTGLVVNQAPNIPRKELRRLRAILHHARFEGLERQNREQIPNFRAWLRGKIAYVRMVRPDIGAKLDQAFRALP